MKQVYQGDISKHGQDFWLAAIMTQIAICNGEPLFQVDYEDPDYNNQYFDDAHILDDNDDGGAGDVQTIE